MNIDDEVIPARSARENELASLASTKASLETSIKTREAHPDANEPGFLKVTNDERRSLRSVEGRIAKLTPPAESVPAQKVQR